MDRSSRIASYGLVGLFAVSLFVALHPIVLTYFNVRFLGGAYGDGGLYVWLAQTFLHAPIEALHFETPALYPYPLTRAWSDSFLLPSAAIALLVKTGLSFPAAYNTVLLSTFALNAMAICALAHSLGLSLFAATIAGVVFANSSYIVGNLGHPQLLFFFWVPFAWSALLHGGGIRRPARNWLLAGLSISGAFYCGVYYAIFGALGLAVLWVRDLLVGDFSQRRMLRVLLLATCGALPILYALPHYLAVQSYFGKRGLYEAADFVASGLSYLSFSPRSDLFGGTASLSQDEALLCPGYVVLTCALIALAFFLHRSRTKAAPVLITSTSLLVVSSSIIDQGTTSELLICVSSWLVLLSSLWIARLLPASSGAIFFITALFFTFSFGPGGNPAKHEPAWAPFGALYSVVPGLASIRAVGRFGSVVIMGAVILAARLCQKLLTSKSKTQAVIASVLVGAFIAENVTSTIPFDTISERPRAFDFVASHASTRDATVVLPFSGNLANGSVESWSQLALLSTEYAQWSAPLGIRIVNGYSGQRSKLQQELPRALHTFPSPSAFSYLSRLCGVRWVVVVPRLSPNWNPEEFKTGLASVKSEIRHTSWFDDGSIAVELSPLSFTATKNSEPIFAPTKQQAGFAIDPQTNESCSIRITTLGRGPSGAPVPLAETSQILTAPAFVQAPPPLNSRRASPQILLVTGEGCTPMVRCELP